MHHFNIRYKIDFEFTKQIAQIETYRIHTISEAIEIKKYGNSIHATTFSTSPLYGRLS